MPTELSDFLTFSWKTLLVQGIAGLLLGLAALIWPGITLLALVVLWGAWALVDGVLMGAAAFRPGPTGQRILFGVMAVLGIVAGLFAFFRPGVTAATLTWVLGIWLLVRGIFELVGAFSATTTQPKGLLVVSALLDIVLGILFWLNPVTGAFSIVWLVGVLAMVWGVIFVVLALRVRKGLSSTAQPAAA